MPPSTQTPRPRPGQARRSQKVSGKKSNTRWLLIGGLAVVAAVAVVVALLVGGGDSASSGSGGTSASGGLSQTRPVTITGTALPLNPGAGTTDPAVGMVAPTISGQTFDGAPISVKPGRPTLLVFVAHWCPHCQREVPQLTAWSNAGEVPAGVDVVAIATSTTNTRPNYPPSAWLEREKFPFPVIADSDTDQAAEAFGLDGFPYFVVLDAEGRVVARASGEVPPATLGNLLEQAKQATPAR